MQKLFFPLLVLAVVLGIIAGSKYFDPNAGNSAKSGLYVDPPGGDFTLNSNKGKVSLSDHKGKVRLLYFGYTFCPDVCPGSLQRIGTAFKKLTPEELKQVHGFFISVDPKRDTLQKLEDYTKYFHPQITGMTGSKADIDEVAKRYDVKYRMVEGSSPESYLVDHTGYIFVLGKDGKISEYMPHAIPIERAVQIIRDEINKPNTGGTEKKTS